MQPGHHSTIYQTLKEDAKFFIPFGVACGFTQFIGYEHFNQSNVGTELLQEHIAFNSLPILFIFTAAIQCVNYLIQKKWSKFKFFDAIISTGWEKVIALSAAAGLIVAGFTIAPLMTKNWNAAFIAICFSLYCLALVVFANGIRLHKEGSSQTLSYWIALGYIVGLPFAKFH